MTDPYIGEIRLFAGSFAPEGWHLCDGTVLTVQGNEALFSLIGGTYGGNGTTQFALPDLRGRVPIHQGQGQNPSLTNRVLGQIGGAEAVALTAAQMPAHTHTLNASTGNATTITPSNSVGLAKPTVAGWGQYFAGNTPASDFSLLPMSGSALSVSGQSQAHPNVMPSLVLTYIICLIGLYPMRPN